LLKIPGPDVFRPAQSTWIIQKNAGKIFCDSSLSS
jgi:hypothetical protein